MKKNRNKIMKVRKDIKRLRVYIRINLNELLTDIANRHSIEHHLQGIEKLIYYEEE